MKNCLLYIFFFIVLIAKTNAQCSITNSNIRVTSFNAGTCTYTTTITYDQEINGGNKWAFIHIWDSASYHMPAAAWPTSGGGVIYASVGNTPMFNQLMISSGVPRAITIAIADNNLATPTISTSYPSDGTVTVQSTGITISKTALSGTMERVTVTGVKLSSGCTGISKFNGDIWFSQATPGKQVHCVNQGLAFTINSPVVTGFKVCSPRSITFGIRNPSTTDPMTVKFILYKEKGGNGTFGPEDSLLITGVDTVLQPGASLSRFQYAFPGSNIPGESASIWVQAETNLGVKSQIMLQNNTCLPLSVKFKSFSAVRNQNNVELNWVTSFESNNKFFELQRKINGNDFAILDFIETKAKDGNSESDLYYSYTDNNLGKGISQYRIRQVDFDGNVKYSEIRSIRGEAQTAKNIIYPNPSKNGNVNVVFNESNVIRDIQLMDINGRVINQWRNYANNNISIENLNSGFYSLRIVDQHSKEQYLEKIIISRN